MKKLLMILCTATLFSFPALANHDGKEHPALQEITVKVNGLVCDFCARSLEKIFYQKEGVYGVDVDLDEGEVEIDITEGTQISDEEITKLITEAGYNVTGITRQ